MRVRQIQITKITRTALLIIGSAFCICACNRGEATEEETNEGLMTQESYNLTLIESNNGTLVNRFETPLMEAYEYAREPYREFRKGVKVTTYNSETNEIESTLVADYAIYFINQDLWEAKGNVVATNMQGHVLETQQLFWNHRTGRIYSNIDYKIHQYSDVIVGVGFESDEQFNDWELRRPRGTTDVDVDSTKNKNADTGDEPMDDQPAGTDNGEPESERTPSDEQLPVREGSPQGGEATFPMDELIPDTDLPLRERSLELEDAPLPRERLSES